MALKRFPSPARYLSELFRRACRRVRKRLDRSAPVGAVAPTYKRFLSDQPRRTEAFLQAAQGYVSRLEGDRLDYLYEKPAARGLAGHTSFYNEMYQVLNLLRAMDVPPGGRILEVGSGPGWVTEIFVSLGYEVECVEPCEDMIRIARERVANLIQRSRLKLPPQVAFHCLPLEDCPLPDDRFDAVFFHAALHHIIDEEKGLAQCYRVLRPGGVVGVSEWAWVPGDRNLEALLEAEMARFGTLENPFTQEYLDDLLARCGFVSVQRYHGVNGLFPAEQGNLRIAAVAQVPASAANTLTARKPVAVGGAGLTTAQAEARTEAEIVLLGQVVDALASRASLKAQLVNRGETVWLPGTFPRTGCVTVALFQGTVGGPQFRESAIRHPLPRAVLPGEQLILDLSWPLPPGYEQAPWYLDLVSEHLFWFSSRGGVAPRIDFSVGGGALPPAPDR